MNGGLQILEGPLFINGCSSVRNLESFLLDRKGMVYKGGCQNITWVLIFETFWLCDNYYQTLYIWIGFWITAKQSRRRSASIEASEVKWQQVRLDPVRPDRSSKKSQVYPGSLQETWRILPTMSSFWKIFSGYWESNLVVTYLPDVT